MLLLAGLMGMMAVGATAFIGFSGSDDNEAEIDRDISEEEAHKKTVSDAENAGTGILAFLGFESEDGASDVATGSDDLQDGDADGVGSRDEFQAVEGVDSLDLTLDIAMDLAALQDIDGSDDLDDQVGDTALPQSTPPEDERVAVGTAADDQMDGTDARDVANGYDGADAMSGGAGADQLWGGLGADTLAGGAGDDTLHGGAGDDAVAGDDGDDRLFGHGGNDTLAGGAGADSLVGSEGDDALDGGAGDDALHGDLGNDLLRGGGWHDVLFGGWGDDTLSGFEDNPDTDGWDDTDVMDFLNGGGGADMITAGAGDMVTTGDGADTVILGDWLSAAHQAEILDFAPDEDTLMVVYDDTDGSVPDVDLAGDPDNDAVRHVMLNGVAIAVVNNAAGLNAGHITVIGASLLDAGIRL
jgi:Ca2+-binding RTX toxin-like protein